MKKFFSFLITICSLITGMIQAKTVTIVYDKTVPQASYAARKLSEALKDKDYDVISQESDFQIKLSLQKDKLKAEAFSIVPEPNAINIYVSDYRGLIYGALALVELLRNGTSLEQVKAIEEKPNLEFRGIKFNLPCFHTIDDAK